jgi:hypothetical protein
MKPLIVCSFGMAAALLVNSVLSKYFVLADNPSPNDNALRAMVAMNFVFSLFFTMIGIISWVYPAEVCFLDPRPRRNKGGKKKLTNFIRSSPPKSAPVATPSQP